MKLITVKDLQETMYTLTQLRSEDADIEKQFIR